MSQTIKAGSSTFTFYGNQEYSQAQSDFLHGNSLRGATLYEQPKGQYKDIGSHFKFGVLNREKDRYVDYAAANSNLTQPFDSDTSLHFKSYTRDGAQGIEAFLPTGNLGDGQGRDNQANTGVGITGTAAPRVEELQHALQSGRQIESVSLGEGYELSLGSKTSQTVNAALAQVTKNDTITVSSPFISERSTINALIHAKQIGANVTVIASPSDSLDTSSRQKDRQRLASAGITVLTSHDRLIHEKNITIRGSKVNFVAVGSDNQTASSKSNRTLDYMLTYSGKGQLLDAVEADNLSLKNQLQTVEAPKPSVYESGEFHFLFKTDYGTVESRTHGTIQKTTGSIGLIKSTKLNSDYFDRHIRQALPHYTGFSTTYEAITGIRASKAIRDMDKAVGSPSIGHQINRALGFKLYTDGMGSVGSLVSLAGRAADYLTGHYAYRQDLERRKGVKGSLKKFEAMLDKDYMSEDNYKGGPIEQASSALYGAARALITSTVSYGAVLAGQYGLSAFLEDGARRAVEVSRNPTMAQAVMARSYLSIKGLEVRAIAQASLIANPLLSPKEAYLQAMGEANGKKGVQSHELLGGGLKLPNVLNRMRALSGGMMEYALPAILEMVVPSAHLPSALRAGKELVEAISAPITLDEEGLHNLHTTRIQKFGRALERVGEHIPLALHMWFPGIRAAVNGNGVAPLDPDAHYPLSRVGKASATKVMGDMDEGSSASLASAMGDGILRNTIGAFLQTTDQIAKLSNNPTGELARLKAEYAATRAVTKLDRQLTLNLNQGSATEADVRAFFKSQTELSEQLKHYGNSASVVSRSADNGVLAQGVFKKSLGRAALGVAAVFVGDFLLDEFAFKTQGADLFQQLALTRAVRNNEGNVIQIELNGTVPLTVAAATAGVSAIATGYVFPTIHGVSRTSSQAMHALSNQTGNLAHLAAEFQEAAGTRARFNFKAAAVGAVLGLVALKSMFVAGAAIAQSFFTVRGVRLDPESEGLTNKLMKILNRTKSKNYTFDAEGNSVIKSSARIGSLITRAVLTDVVDDYTASDIRAANRSAGSSFYTVDAQFANTGFLQMALIQRTDSLKQKTTYSFGIQLFASAGMGLTPNLPVGLVTQQPTKQDQQQLARLRKESYADRFGANPPPLIVANIIQGALNTFGFLSYEPNSQITNGLYGLGALSYITSAANRIEAKVTKYGRTPELKTEAHLDLDAFAKAAKLGLQLTTGFVKYSTALSDFLPRMIASGVKNAFGELTTDTRIGLIKKLAAPVYKARFGILGYALGVAMSDPILGVEALDATDSRAGEHPFTNPINRLTTALSASAATVYAAHALGLSGRPQPNSLLSQLVPGARAEQEILHSVEANQLRRSGARTALVAGVLFTSYVAADVLARTIGSFGGEDALANTYQRFGLLRLMSGVAASSYRTGDRYAQRNLIGDVALDLIKKIPFIGQGLVELTGLYKDNPKLHLPIIGTPFGASYSNDGTIRTYGMVTNGSSDTAISSYSKFKLGFNRDTQRMMANLEAIDFDRSERPDELAYAVMIGGVARSKQMQISDISKYAIANIDGDSTRAFNIKIHQRNWVKAQRAGELLLHERRRGRAMGEMRMWMGSSKDKLPLGRVGSMLGLNIKTIEYDNSGKVIDTGTEQDFSEAYENSAYKDRNMYVGSLLQPITDMYAAFTPQSKKHDVNVPAAAVLSVVGSVVATSLLFNTLLNAAEFIGALEVVKYGASAERLATDRLNLGKQFRSRNNIDIHQTYEIDGKPSATIKQGAGNQGVGFTHQIGLEQYGLTEAKSVGRSYRKAVTRLQDFFKQAPTSMTFNGLHQGVSRNAYDLLLAGESSSGISMLQGAFAQTLGGPEGVLNQTIGKSDFYGVFVNHSRGGSLIPQGVNAIQYAAHVAHEDIYAPLVDYARQLNARSISQQQKRELLAAAKIQIEMHRVESQILSMATNITDRTPALHLPQLEEAPMGVGLGQTFKRAAGGAGILLGGYLVFGKDAYQLAEASVYLTGSNAKMRFHAAEQIYNTATNLGLALGLQKVIGSVFGIQEHGFGSLALMLGASVGLNLAASAVKETPVGRGITAIEKGIKSVAVGGLSIAGEILSYAFSYPSDILSRFIFTPLGMKIGEAYNTDSRTSAANAQLAELFLPTSVFKTNSYTPKRTSVGYLPFVMAAEGNVDLRAYYRAQNEAELKGSQDVSLNPKYISEFTLGRVDRKDYNQNVFYNKFFNMQMRSAASPLSDFAMGSNYRMSETLILAIGMRAAASDRERYGRVFRRAAHPNHDYTGQFVSGLAVGNEAARIATEANSTLGRVAADAMAQADNLAFNPMRRVAKGITRFLAVGTNRISYHGRQLLDPISRGLQLVGEFISHLLGGTRMVAAMTSQAVAEASAGGVQTGVASIEQRLEGLSEVITERFGGPVAQFALEALQGIGTLVGAGASLVMRGIQKLPTIAPVDYSVIVPKVPRLGFNSLPALPENWAINSLARPLKGAASFIRGNIPFYLDAFQTLPSAYALQGADEEQLTRMERQRLYEQNASAIGGTLVALGANALRFNLLTTIGVSLIASFESGQLGRKAASADYDQQSMFYRNLQTGLSVVTTGLSAVSSLISYYRRIKIYNNYTEIYTNEHDSKRARAVYDAKFEERMQAVDSKIERLNKLEDSTFKRQQLQQLNQERIGLRFEYHHEQAHLKQFDLGAQEFVATNPVVQSAEYHRYVTPQVSSTLRSLAEQSAQERLYENPNIDQHTYNHIVELEHTAHVEAYVATLTEAHGTPIDLRHTPEQALDHYVARMERQIGRGRSYTRTPGVLPPGVTVDPIERLYNPTASGTARLFKGEGFNAIHYEKFGNLVTSGFSKSARLVAALQSAFGLPAALAEVALQKEELNNIQSTYGSSNAMAVTTALKARGDNNARYLYAGSITGALSAVFDNPIGLVAVALYGGIAAFGGSIPFTTIPLVPTLGRGELATAYSNYMRSKMRQGDYAYEPWTSPSAPINALKHHTFDGADRIIVHTIASRLGHAVGGVVKYTSGLFRYNPSVRNIATTLAGVAALSFLANKTLGLRDANLTMFTAGIVALAVGGYHLGKWALTKLPMAITAVKKFFIGGLEEITLGNGTEYVLKTGGKATVGNKAVFAVQALLSRVGLGLKKLRDIIGMYQVWNQPTARGTFTGLPTKYLGSDPAAYVHVSGQARAFFNVISGPQRLFTFGHRAWRASGIVLRGLTHAIEDFGIRGGLKLGQASGAGQAATGIGARFLDAIDRSTENLFKYLPIKPKPQLGTATVSWVANLIGKMGWLPRVAKWTAEAAVKYLPIAGKVLGIAGVLAAIGYSAYKGGPTGFVGAAALAIGTYGAYRVLASSSVGKAVSNSILREGLVGSALNGIAVAVDMQAIVSSFITVARGDRRKFSNLEYQQSYINAAGGTAGLISTLTLFPRLGLVRGLLATVLLSAGLTKLSEDKANERLLQSNQGDDQPMAVLAVRDILKPAINETFFAKRLEEATDLFAQTKMGKQLTSSFSKLRPVRAWRKAAIGLERTAAQVIKTRAARTFGEAGADSIKAGIKSLGEAGAGFARGVGGFFKGISIGIDIGLTVYGSSQVVNAKNDVQRTEGYRTAFGAGGSLIGSILGGSVGTAFEAAPGVGTVLHIGLTIGGSVLGQAIGDKVGELIGQADAGMRGAAKFDVGKAFSNLFGGDASAAEVPPQYRQQVSVPTSLQDRLPVVEPSISTSKPWYASALDSTKSAVNLAINWVGSQWKGVQIGIGNLHKEAKLKWGRFASIIGGNHTILGFNPMRAIVGGLASLGIGVTPSTATSGTTAFGSTFNGAYPTADGLVKSNQTLPAWGKDAAKLIARGGNVFTGREVVLEFKDSVAVTAGVRGKSIRFDSDLRAFSDLVALGESGAEVGNIKGYTVPSTGSPSGRYQIGYNQADTKELTRILKTGIHNWSPSEQDRAFAGRLFYKGLNAGGTEYLNFVKGGYKYDDFFKLITAAARQYQTFGSKYQQTPGGNSRDYSFLEKHYGSADAGIKFLYQTFLLRKSVYDGGKGITAPIPTISPTQADAIVRPLAGKEIEKPNATKNIKFKPATIKYGTKVSSVPAPAGKQLRQPPKEVAMNISMVEGQLKVTATQQDTAETYFNAINVPGSQRVVGGMALKLA